MELTQDWLNRYIEHLDKEKGLSRHTQMAYRRDMEPFYQFCVVRSISSWDGVTSVLIRQYISQCHQKGKSGKSLQRVLSSVRGFYHYLIREQVLENNPATSVMAPKSKHQLPSLLDVDEVQGLLNSGSEQPLMIRDIAIFELIYSSGLRVSEVAQLNQTNIDFGEGTVRVLGKGNKTRIVPVGAYALKAVQAWLPYLQRLAEADESALFVNRYGKRLSIRSIQKRLDQWALKQGLLKHVHPHMLRHSFASHILESSGDLRAVQELLGHADISTTQIYTHLNFQHLANVYDQTHPRAKVKKRL